MWSEFLAGVLACVVLLHVPGYLFLRGLRVEHALALACAPLYGVAAYALLPILYYELGVPCSLVNMVVPTLLVALGVFGLAHLRTGRDGTGIGLAHQEGVTIAGRSLPFDVAVVGLYVVLALVVCVWVFAINLPHPHVFLARYDNQTHLNLVRAFLDSGKWSSLHTSVYAAATPQAYPMANPGGFYPAAWHCVTALVSLASGASVTASVNVVIVVMTSFMFPLSFYAFLRALFPRDRMAVIWGAVAATGCATWPWLFEITGPLYPYQMGLSLVLGLLALVVAFAQGKKCRSVVLQFVLVCLVAFVAVGLAHPSAVFFAYVFLAFYGSWMVMRLAKERTLGRARGKVSLRVVAVAAYWLAVVLVWAFLFNSSLFHNVTTNDKTYAASFVDVWNSLFMLEVFTLPLPQWGMIVASVAGAAFLLKSRDQRWILLPAAYYAVAAVLTLVDADVLGHWLGGFWYNDNRRLSINYAISLMPVVALGLRALFSVARDASRSRVARTLGCVGLALCLTLTYMPAVLVPVENRLVPVSQLQVMKGEIARLYNDGDDHVYSARELEFVRRAQEVLPKNALVANVVPDGSVWAYAVNGLNTAFRSHRTGAQTPEAELVRKHLSEYATNPEVRDAVEHMGITHVLQLSAGVSFEDGVWLMQVSEADLDEWAGISAVDEHTPGFSLVLSEGDHMRLYEIVR